MLKKLLGLAIITAFASTAVTPVIAADTPFYVGGQIGAAKLKETESGFSESFDFTTLSAVAGYSFNQYLAAEIRLGTGIRDESFSEGGFSEKFKISQQNLLLVKGTVPVSEAFSLYGLAGFGSVKFKYEEREPGFSYSETDTVDGFSWGVGAAFNITSNWSASLEYLQLPEETFREGPFTLKFKTSSVNLGVNYRF